MQTLSPLSAGCTGAGQPSGDTLPGEVTHMGSQVFAVTVVPLSNVSGIAVF